MEDGKKIKVIILSVCIALALIAIFVISTSNSEPVVDNNQGNGNGGVIDNTQNSVIDKKEKELSKDKAQEYFENLPLVYTEEYAPFTDSFMLSAAMDIVLREQEPNYAATHVDKIVEDIFGDGVSINKENVKTMDATVSLYYYYPETGSYCIVPVGTEFVYMTQLLKTATEYEDNVYVYTYELNGSWHQEEDKYVVVVGDKSGNDLVKSFDTYEGIKDYSAWLEEYKEKLPVFKYTLKKQQDTLVLVGVERVNY